MEAPSKKATKGGEQCTASSSSSAITNLPRKILMEFLFRLPIKTLVACKCVCKSWLHLVSDPHFSKLHQARANIELCFQDYYDEKEMKLYMGNFCFMNDSHCLDLKFNTLLELPKFSVKPSNVLNYKVIKSKMSFVNSCNGLLCFCGEPNNFAVIWNPITSEFVTFPAPKVNRGLSTCHAYGLGFSQKSNRFKLLRIIARKEKKSSEHELVVAEICTIEKGCSWRTIGPCPYSIWRPFGPYAYNRPLGSFFLSALHWVGADCRETDMAIVSFDFEDEKFGKVPLPPHFKTMDPKYPFNGVGVLAGCLFVTDHTNRRVSVWFMKEYGVQDSWTKVFSLPFTLDQIDRNKSWLPINYPDNGEIMMARDDYFGGTDLFLYNQILKSIRVLGFGPRMLRVFAYIPSLVLLKDSMMGYDVHVKSRRADLKYEEVASPSWWKPVDHVVARRLELQEPQHTQMSEYKIRRFIEELTVESIHEGHLTECCGDNFST